MMILSTLKKINDLGSDQSDSHYYDVLDLLGILDFIDTTAN